MLFRSIDILNLIENGAENFVPLMGLSSATFERIFNNYEILFPQVDEPCVALAILSIMRPIFYREIILNTS